MESIYLASKQLFFFILIISGNYLGELFSCRTQKLFTNNMIVKHILGIMTMFFFVTLIDDGDSKNDLNTIYISLGLYILFVLISLT